MPMLRAVVYSASCGRGWNHGSVINESQLASKRRMIDDTGRLKLRLDRDLLGA